jgi:glutamine synthetase
VAEVLDESGVEWPAAESGEAGGRAEKLKAFLLEQGVKYCMATWTDTHGRAKAKVCPIEKFDKVISGRGPLYTVHALEGMGSYGPMVRDQASLPDLDSVQICPWDPSVAWFAGDIHWNGGEPYPLCSRSALKRQLARARELGLAFMVGVEPEFYVYRRGEHGEVLPLSPLDVGPSWAYDAHMVSSAAPFLHQVAETLRELGWGVDAFVTEGGHSQYEFDYGFADALVTADRWIFLKEVLKHAAERIGAFVTFMAKPFDDAFRSGLHYNMSLVDAGTGQNLMRSEDDPRGFGFSKLAYQFIAGQLAHATAITAVTCPTVNSYRGFVGSIDLAGLTGDMSWAPIGVTYGFNNRSAMLRLPDSRDCLENRATDASCNIYLGLAMSLAAGLEGIERELDPGDPCPHDLYKLADADRSRFAIDQLPQDLGQAIDGLERDRLTADVLGSELKQAYVEMKRGEWAAAQHHVSQWDRDRYLELF